MGAWTGPVAQDRDRWGILWMRWWTFGFSRMRGVSLLAEDRLASVKDYASWIYCTVALYCNFKSWLTLTIFVGSTTCFVNGRYASCSKVSPSVPASVRCTTLYLFTYREPWCTVRPWTNLRLLQYSSFSILDGKWNSKAGVIKRLILIKCELQWSLITKYSKEQ